MASVKHVEIRTAAGQLLHVRCRQSDEQEVRRVLGNLVQRVDLPSTYEVSTRLTQGGYTRYSRYAIVQHEYCGGPRGFMEVLEITDPPDGRAGFVVHEYDVHEGSVFWEFPSRATAVDAFNGWAGCIGTRRKVPEAQLRRVECGAANPWFYAIGDQTVVGDIVLPEAGLISDPYFVTGRRFILRDREGIPDIKRCLAVRERDGKRCVIWYDGTSWDERQNGSLPQILDEQQEWIEDAMHRFRELLAGSRRSFEIPFVDGAKFLGRITGPAMSPGGVYKMRVRLRDETGAEEVHIGTIEFHPTENIRTLEQHVRAEAATYGRELVAIEACTRQRRRGTKGWTGVYPAPPVPPEPVGVSD